MTTTQTPPPDWNQSASSTSLIDVDVAPVLAERLNGASVRRRYYPFDDDVIDWSVPLTDDWSYMPEEHSVFAESDILARLDPRQRSYVERWEMTQLMRNIAHGEHLLNQGILAMLWRTDPLDPSYRFLLHEIAEECQHMAMFNQWVRINEDIETGGAGEAGWGQRAAERSSALAEQAPEAFWVSVLLFEFVGDDFNLSMRANATGGLHPIVVQMGKVHTAEETRHIAYARAWLEAGMAKLDDDERSTVASLTKWGAQQLIDRRAFLPVRWNDQLAPFMTQAEFVDARSTSPAGPRMLRQLKLLLDDLESLDAIDAATMRAWERDGAFG